MSEFLSLVVPALNEEMRLPRALGAIRRCLDQLGIPYEVIVVDDGSGDTTEVVREAARPWNALRLIELRRNQGKGAAVREGMLASRGTIVGFVDADLSAPIEQIVDLIEDLHAAG